MGSIPARDSDFSLSHDRVMLIRSLSTCRKISYVCTTFIFAVIFRSQHFLLLNIGTKSVIIVIWYLTESQTSREVLRLVCWVLHRSLGRFATFTRPLQPRTGSLRYRLAILPQCNSWGQPVASLGVSGKWRVFVSCSFQKLHRNSKKYTNVLYRKRWFMPVILVEFELVLFVPFRHFRFSSVRRWRTEEFSALKNLRTSVHLPNIRALTGSL